MTRWTGFRGSRARKRAKCGNQDLQRALQVSLDGKTAVIAMRMESGLMVGDRAG